ncbi:MAG: hypothetical protein MUD10_01150 [Candidatus Pacebacteria bacterium]|jgi:hypothetical protein|nr:hypothetical protein [Candidatus Paceibacterota bacterium]
MQKAVAVIAALIAAAIVSWFFNHEIIDGFVEIASFRDLFIPDIVVADSAKSVWEGIGKIFLPAFLILTYAFWKV